MKGEAHFKPLLVSIIASTFICWVTQHNLFFWDSAYTAGTLGHFFVTHPNAGLILPAAIDAGHPPVFAWLLAQWYGVAGYGLAQAHWFMWPWLVLLFWQLWVLAGQVPAWRWFVFLVLMLEPTLLTQATLVSPEVPLLAFGLLATNGILYKRSWLLAIGLLIMPLCSFRGIMLVPFFSFWWLWVNYYEEDNRTIGKVLRNSWPLWGGIITAATWLGWHWAEAGWIISNPAGQWSSHREVLGFSGMLRNLAVIAFRLVDNGRIAWWLVASVLLFLNRKHLVFNKNGNPLTAGLVLLLFLYPLLFTPFGNPVGARYFLLGVLMGMVWLIQQLQQPNHLRSEKLRMVLVAVLLISSISPHFWVLPGKMAKTWDASLAHYPWHGLLRQSLDFMEYNSIKPGHVASSFPLDDSLQALSAGAYEGKFTILESDAIIAQQVFKPRFVLYSNIMNGLPQHQLDSLETWRTVAEWQQGHVWLRLAGNPHGAK